VLKVPLNFNQSINPGCRLSTLGSSCWTGIAQPPKNRRVADRIENAAALRRRAHKHHLVRV